jgi:hypothetical protein
MNDNSLVFLIGLGIGLGIAAGIRPFLPALLAGGLAAAKVLGLRFSPGNYSFLQASWWLIVVAALLLLAYAIQLRVHAFSDSRAAVPVFAGLGIAVGALLFAGTLCGHGRAAWPGLLGGAVAALLAEACVSPFVTRVRARLADRAAREAVTIYLDVLALLVAAVSAAFHPLGYVALVLIVWFGIAGRGRGGGRYAGLRILGKD